MKNIAVFFGGVSCEHDISVITGLLTKENLNKLKYRVFPIYMHTDGAWYLATSNCTVSSFQGEFDPLKGFKRVMFLAGDKTLYEIKGKKYKIVDVIDCAVLCNHGVNGEDGSLAGFLQLCNVPCTSGGLFGAACSMDKVLMKEMFKGLKAKQFPYVYFEKREFKKDADKILKSAAKKLGYPIIIKPANLGSSIGISVCHNYNEFEFGVQAAFEYDNKVIAEKAATDFIELNCSAVFSKGNILVSSVEQPLSYKEFLNFDEKYKGGKKGGMETCKRKLPADIDIEKSEEIKLLTMQIYKHFDCRGVIRVDYIMQENAVYVNEINTIPGSLAYYLWEYDGIPFKSLLDILIDEALDAFDNFKNCKFAFNSDVLKGSFNIKK